jgi:peptide-methionine (S)-S-oxide reductase
LSEGSTATLGGGCFWCLEAVFQRVKGVNAVEPGYAGGHVEAPTYREVCRGTTGHAEVVRIRFDPAVVPYRRLLDIFFTIHDPTTPDRQGADVGPQYRSIVLYHDAEQEQIARETMAELEEEARWPAPLVTQLQPLRRFYPAESEHHRYHERNPGQAYCRLVIDPKVRAARARFSDLLAE